MAETYWVCVRNEPNLVPCGGDPDLHALAQDQSGTVRIESWSQPDTRTLDIELLVDADSDHEAHEQALEWLNGYLSEAEWLKEIGIYDPESEEADWHEPAEIFGVVGLEVRDTD